MQPLTGRDPTALGTYTLTGRLGTGGFGVVYAAQDTEGAPVAIKLLDSGLSSDQAFRDRLVREGTAMRLVESDRTVRVVEVVSEGEDAYLVMELIDGTPLDTYVDTNGPFRGLELWLIASGLVEALNAIHSAGIIHRDLKPANVMYGADGVKVLDFGISAVVGDNPHTRTGTFLASANWTSPEQFRDEPVTTASDVFMLGLVLAYVATGQHPFGTGRSDAIMFRIAHESPDLALVQPPLHEVVTACLAKNPAERPSPQALQHFFSNGGNEALRIGGDLGNQGTLVLGSTPLESTTASEGEIDLELASDAPQVDDPVTEVPDVASEVESEPATGENKTTVVSTPPRSPGVSEHKSEEPKRRQPNALISAVIALVAILGISSVMFAALGGEKPDNPTANSAQDDSASSNDATSRQTNQENIGEAGNGNSNSTPTTPLNDSDGSPQGVIAEDDDPENNSVPASLSPQSDEPESTTTTPRPTTTKPTAPTTATTTPTSSSNTIPTSPATTTAPRPTTTTTLPYIPGGDSSGPSLTGLTKPSTVNPGGTIRVTGTATDPSGISNLYFDIYNFNCQEGSNTSAETTGNPTTITFEFTCVVSPNQGGSTYQAYISGQDPLGNNTYEQWDITVSW